MARNGSISGLTVVRTFLVFLVVVAGNVLTNGLGCPAPGRLALAAALIGLGVSLVVWRVRRFARLDELQQRIELQAYAAAFAGSFIVFVGYCLLQAAGLLPPLIGTYYVIGMISLVMVGSEGAWKQLVRSPLRTE
jgi:hypothetical protein